MRILVFGGHGMLGHKLVQVLGEDNEVFATIRDGSTVLPGLGFLPNERLITHADVREPGVPERIIEKIRPECVINSIGVIKQLKDASDPITMIELNALFPHRLSSAAGSVGARMITFSTDCVFDGAQGRYTEESKRDAEDLYGRTKALGELAGPGRLTIRSSIIGRQLRGKAGLIEWFVSNRDGRVSGFSKAIYSGLTTLEMSRLVRKLLVENEDLHGVYHVASDRISKFDLLVLVNESMGLGIEIDEETEFEIDRSLVAARFESETGYSPPSWRQMIKEMAADSAAYDEWRRLES